MNLTIFNQLDFLPALREFFKVLQVPIAAVTDKPIAARDILESNYKDNESFRLIDEVYFLGMVDDAAFRGGKSLDISQIKSDYDGIVIFGVTLKVREGGRDGGLLPTRSQLAEIARAFNREFCYTPVVVVFKYADADNAYLAFANTERLKYKDNREGEKAGKVTLLRDIDIRQPHSGHERILANLAISTTGKNKVDSFASLYKYWQEVLSVSLLNKDFYKDLSNWYFWAVGRVTFPSEPTLLEAQAKKVSLEDLQKEHKSKNVIRLLTRLLFVWFIKEKGLIPPELFELDDLQRNILKNISPYNDLGLFKQLNQDSIYYKAILQNLFFATLNCPIKPMESHDNRVRGFRKMDNYGQHRDANFLMRYEKHFQNPDRFVEMVNGVVPFLNGGLFECLDDKLNKVYIDGFSDNLPKNEQLIVPDYLFFGVEEKVDLSAEYGVTNKATKEAAVKGLINILKAYKFTITENTPIEEDVALDPELLGKVFENLLASYNPETKTTARKQTGSFYTPREIVNYMVDESLIAYLKNELLAQESGYQEQDLDRQLRQLVSFDAVNPFERNAEVQKRIIKALDKCTILDPACGSGAFPMGILQKMVHILFKVDPKNTEWKQRQIVRVEAAISQLEELDDAQYREQGIQDLNAQIKDIEEAFANNELDYGRKLYLIENCIYGVDIQSIATQISKLRFFISLVVDQRVDPTKDNFGIRPLPNLETKFVAANTLIGIEKPKAQLSLFDTPEIKKLEADLKKVRHRLFSSKSPSHKRKLRDQDKALREQIAVVLQRNGYTTDTANKLANWDPYNLNNSAGFFDSEWMFGITNGFDVVIGNPPYGVSIKGNDRSEILKFLNKVPDYEIYYFFIEVAYKIVADKGTLSYIVPNTYLFNVFAENYRSELINKWGIKLIIDFTNFSLFDTATVRNSVFLISKGCTTLKVNYLSTSNEHLTLDEFISQEMQILDVSLLKEFSQNWALAFKLPQNKINAIASIKKNAQPLNHYFPEISQGLIAYDKYQGQSQDVIESRAYHFNHFKDGLKKWLWGEDVRKYKVNWNGKEFIDYCKGIANPRQPKYFIGKRMLVREITNPSIFAAITNDEMYNDPSILIILSSAYSLEAATMILNSCVGTFFHFNSSPKATKGDFPKILVKDLKEFPLPKNFGNLKNDFWSNFYQIISTSEESTTSKINFSSIIDAACLNLYFPDHMKERDIDVFGFVEQDITEIMQGRKFKNLLDEEKQKVIEQLYAKWTDPDNEVRNRIKLFAVRSPDILKPILESK
jgi:tRNA1(Val) A37 N6-methylase TrmN6